MSVDPVQLGKEVVRSCLDEGFALAGVALAQPSERQLEFRGWLAGGRHGTMRWLESEIESRLDPDRLVRGARAFVMVADRYAASAGRDEAIPPNHGRVARYARGRDYHAVVKKRLHRVADALRARFPGHVFRSFADTAPVMEREHAVRAGLGWTGKHTLLINPGLGSYLVLGGFLTTLPLEPEPGGAPVPDACGSCTRCIDSCPTGAIRPYSVDASRCISYLTIERRGPVAAPFQGPIGDRLFGCDICQEVCPYNASGAAAGSPMRAEYLQARASLDVLEVLDWTDKDRSALTASAMKRATTDMFRRNAAIVAANLIRSGHGDAARLRAKLRVIADDAAEIPMVRDAAAASLAGLPDGTNQDRRKEGAG